MDLSRFDNSRFDRGAPRSKEALWWVVRSVFFAGWLPLPSRLRVFWLGLFGAKVGVGVVIRSQVNITFPWRFECGNHVWIGEGVTILSLARVRLGDNVCVSQQAFLCTGSHDFERETFDLIARPITIASGSWVGARAFVGPGVELGAGSRCLAGATVVKPVAAGVTVGGVPARPRETV
ncbi:WcaF family extracellular polysaccharide biosynthesis acetyltransferase [Thioclava pacifica]|uniref:Acetyltransferase n=1 Tax=Thioclava pacifica DSM 10166 TaxID=1353537 RepID=A0A074JGL3_9RHOB|nr:WcaF family extracellular polysaccharide biosynthesis acetyltransferase [Thioclava pacifica]KEO54708.1 hypothetical protein TP2_17385 [Thioclava pacifica DSM 10166]